MRRIIKIPEYSVEIQFNENNINCFNLISNEVVESISYKTKILDITKQSFNHIKILNYKGDNDIHIDLVKKRFDIDIFR